ncbi:MAG TPA: EAL domain-containing protein [Candidatus Dormibacteraeota bacterium]|jgi:EAL domain-containing protein (putative c-di-GMP-specific phosphodiesterase class I)
MANGPALIFGTQVFPIAGNRLVVGRGDKAAKKVPDLDLEPLDNEHVVSRQHAEIEYQAGITIIRDLGSRNGTFVNDERLDPSAARHINDGDSVRFGHIAFAFSINAAWPDDVSAPTNEETFVASSLMMRALKGITVADTAKPAEGWKEQVARIQQVLKEGLITMVFQPIVDLQEGVVRGVESLARLTAEPRRTPDLWFIEAKNVGLGVELELMAIRDALLQLDRLPPSCYMSINASPETANAPGLAQALADVPLDRVVLEVTEHDAVADYQVLLHSLQDLRANGLRLAVDDMGSGYANLRHILQLAPDIIKLDVELTRGIDQDTPRRALAASFASFATQIGAKIVAEGIETETEFNVLKDLGVQLGQGYYMARPGPLPLPAGLRAAS